MKRIGVIGLDAAVMGISAISAGDFEAVERSAEQEWAKGYRSYQRGTSIAQVNRHTGKPHEHKREIARYLRRPTA